MVVLEKEPDVKLGISIRGGGKESKGNPLNKNDDGIFISKVRRVSTYVHSSLLVITGAHVLPTGSEGVSKCIYTISSCLRMTINGNRCVSRV